MHPVMILVVVARGGRSIFIKCGFFYSLSVAFVFIECAFSGSDVFHIFLHFTLSDFNLIEATQLRGSCKKFCH